MRSTVGHWDFRQKSENDEGSQSPALRIIQGTKRGVIRKSRKEHPDRMSQQGLGIP